MYRIEVYIVPLIYIICIINVYLMLNKRDEHITNIVMRKFLYHLLQLNQRFS